MIFGEIGLGLKIQGKKEEEERAGEREREREGAKRGKKTKILQTVQIWKEQMVTLNGLF